MAVAGKQWRNLIISPSEPVSLRRDRQGLAQTLFTRGVAQATSSVFERASISLRRGEARLCENAWRLLFLCVELSPKRRELA